jgi:hypothetical protein
LGYQPAQFDPAEGVFTRADLAFRDAVEAGHYELGFWMQYVELSDLDDLELAGFAGGLRGLAAIPRIAERTATIPVSVDVHHALALDLPAGDLLRRARRLAGDIPLHVPPMEWLAFHALFKLYWESGRAYGDGLQNLADLARLLRAMRDEETGMLVDLVESHQLQAGGYFLMRRWQDLGIRASDVVVRCLESWRHPPDGVTPERHHDIGDPWPRLFAHL